jgi:hypothetical protein
MLIKMMMMAFFLNVVLFAYRTWTHAAIGGSN